MALYPELEVFLDTLNATNKLSEARFLDFYDGGSWHYTTKANEVADNAEVVEQCILPVGGGIQPEKWYPRKWASQLSGLYQRFRELPSRARAFYKADLEEEQDGKECQVMAYNVVNNIFKKHQRGDQPMHILGAGVAGPFWTFYDAMSRVKDTYRYDPIISSGAAKMQQEVVRSMTILHHMHAPGEAALEIPLPIFEHAKLEVTYFNTVANIGRPPSVGNSNVTVNPDDNVLTVVNKKMLLAMRGQKIMGAVVLNMINQTRDQLENWFVREGAPLVRAGIVQLNKNSNGFSVEKRVPPAEDPQKQEFAEVLLRESNLTVQEYTASLEPPRKRRLDPDTAATLLDATQSQHITAMPAREAISMSALQFGPPVEAWRPPPPPLPQSVGHGFAEAVAMSPPTGPNYGYGRGSPPATWGRPPFGPAGTPAMPGMLQALPGAVEWNGFPGGAVATDASSATAASSGQRQPPH